MRSDLWACAAAAVLLGVVGLSSSANAQQISGSFQATCRNIQVFGSSLTAECRDPSGHYHTSSIAVSGCRGDIGNNNGTLFCNGAVAGGGSNQGFANPASGSFERSCRSIQTRGNVVSAFCADASGHYRPTSLAFDQCRGDIGNNNGTLFCNGSAAPSGPSAPAYGGNGQGYGPSSTGNGQGNGQGYGGGNGQGGGQGNRGSR